MFCHKQIYQSFENGDGLSVTKFVGRFVTKSVGTLRPGDASEQIVQGRIVRVPIWSHSVTASWTPLEEYCFLCSIIGKHIAQTHDVLQMVYRLCLNTMLAVKLKTCRYC
jgi:hypothetical protein